MRWEYAELCWGGSGLGDSRFLAFTHHAREEPIDSDAFWIIMRRLGEDSWELVSVTADRLSGSAGRYYIFKRQLAE